ncbi:MAG: 50S ribosomal protein L19 [Planctomycetes bacterium]|nr:50S ribosomal protein L19 [Planctomycetota bacterium]
MELLKAVTKAHLRTESLGDFRVGDTVNVHTRIKEGDKERIQLFNGTVTSRCRGQGEINASFTVRRMVSGEGVERIFPVHSPRIVKVEVVRRGRVRRAKLYYLRDRVGKATKVKEQLVEQDEETAAVGASTAATAAPKAAAGDAKKSDKKSSPKK